jgi:hypothetical protein
VTSSPARRAAAVSRRRSAAAADARPGRHAATGVEAVRRRLADAAPDFAGLSPNLCARFEARRFRDAELVWLNRRWFVAAGLDMDDALTARAVERLMLEDYGVGIADPALPAGTFVGPPLAFEADRYGATGGTSQGGSGRVGMRGPFNVKGIGRTPLVSAVVDWQHSHGCLWLEEAIREAIFGEIVDAEFPHRAVPVIAIIATGIEQVLEDGEEIGERALLVRPNFLRLATLQRSVFFGSAGFAGSDQYRDAQRTREIWERLWQPEFRQVREKVACPSLEETFARIGEQYGFGHAVRLWPGPLFASNVSLDGRLVDFGSMRALPSWHRAQSKFASHSFGGERTIVAKLARSIATIGAKHGCPLDAERLVAAFETGREQGFEGALARHGVGRGSAESKALHDLFAAQQRRRSTLWDDMSGEWPFDAGHPRASLLLPRTSLLREALRSRVSGLCRRKPADVDGRRGYVTGLIEHEVGLARR